MIKKTGYVVGGIGLQTGMAAVVLYVLNMAVWSVLTALLGGSLGLIGLGLIMWALYPHRGAARAEEGDEQAETAQPDMVAQPA